MLTSYHNINTIVNLIRGYGFMLCVICDKDFLNKNSLCNHLRTHNISTSEYYRNYLWVSGCDVCSNENCENTTRPNGLNGYDRYCSSKCATTSERHINIVKNRFVGNIEKKNISVERRRITILERYTEEQRIASNKKIYETKKRRYGENFQSLLTKKQWENYSYEERKQISEKIANNTHIYYYDYDFFGTIVKIQGYESYILDCLIHDYKMSRNDIIIGVKNVPKFEYVTDRAHIYYPDIYLPRYNLIIEVKSEYTYLAHKKVNIAKQNAVLKHNFHFLFAMVNIRTKDNLKISLECFKNKLDWIISNQDSKSSNVDMSKVQRLFLTEVESSDSKCGESLNV